MEPKGNQVLRVMFGVYIYLFVVYFFISDIRIPFSKRSEVDSM